MKIGKYEVIEEIGRGAMGVVYKAFDPQIGREVAIKVISENALALPEIKERFYREARSVGKLNHENITIVHDVGEVEGKPYLVMEYLAGIDLKLIIHEKAPVRLLQKLDYARQIGKGLQYAHAHHVIHRDIKPENIKILPDGNIKIMDFGIARPTGSELTAPGMMLGTPWYMSPEQIKGQMIDVRSDIFSFGIVLFELLMYKKPFEGKVSTVIYSITHEEPAPINLDESHLVADIQNLLAQCLAKNAGERYRDCAALLKDLDGIIAKGRQQEQGMLDDLKPAERRVGKKKEYETASPLEEVGNLIARGKAFLAKNEYSEALSRFKAALAIDAKNREALELIATCERKQKEAQQISIWLNTARKQFEKGAYDDSLNTAQTILALDPNHAEAGDWAKKNQYCLDQAEKIEKLFADAEFYLKREKFAQAREVYQEILKLAPANKNAARGLERAEKGLQSRQVEAKPSQKTLLEPIDQTPTVLRSKPKSFGKGLWIGLAVVVLIGLAGAWSLWFRPNSQTQIEQRETPDFTQKAAAAKKEMLEAKTEAQQAGAERWAPETYQQALQEEQRGENEFSQSNFASAWQAYNAAMENFINSIAEAGRNTEAASLNELKNGVAKVMQAMLKEKIQAEKMGAKTKVRELFAQALMKEEDGRKSFDRGDRDGYLAAQKSYAEAGVGYMKAGEEAALAKLAEEAESARKDMAAAKQQIQGREEDKNASSNFKKAVELETAGKKQFERGDFRDAKNFFEQAGGFYTAVTKDMVRDLGRGGANAAKAAVLEAHAKVEKESYGEAKYREAERIRNEADKDYNESNFEDAVKKYQAAEALFIAVARERAEKLAGESEKRQATKQAIDALIAAFEQRLERKDYNGFKALFKNFKPYEAFWSAFFKSAKDIKVTIGIKNIAPSGGQANVDIEMNVDYYDTNRGQNESQTMGSTSWTLEQINGKWVIVTLFGK